MASYKSKKGRLTISSLAYSIAFISKAWLERGMMTDYERKGFYQFLYIVACGHAEYVISQCLKNRLWLPIMEMRGTKNIPDREANLEGKPHKYSYEPFHRSVLRLLERQSDDLDKAPLNALESAHATILGSSIKNIIGDNLHQHLLGLASIRNVVAHGRELYIDLIDIDKADLTFEQHPLEHAIKSLKSFGIFPDFPEDAQPDEVKSVIFLDDSVRHFWNCSSEIGEIYRQINKEENVLGPFFFPALQKLP